MHYLESEACSCIFVSVRLLELTLLSLYVRLCGISRSSNLSWIIHNPFFFVTFIHGQGGKSVFSWGRLCSKMVTENNFYWYEKVQVYLVGNFGLYFPESFIVCTTQINLLELDICQMEREFHDFYEIWLFDQFEGTGRRFFKLWFV